ncbi:hypothetical protein ACFSTE_10845 [Aquimarina hainanensis]|uniref:Acyl carrier protein n=1 Tax=Aquimarina hainanensis TaxID=1578017 RepID=A0ABW5N6S9_9FLAO|nr:hypothetical protein [Aquimarina sp. TRL1]
MDILEKERIVQKNVLEIFRDNFKVEKTDEEILNMRPEKEFDANFVTYYESILDVFLIEEEHLNSITGKVKDTIKKVARLWNLTPHYQPW